MKSELTEAYEEWINGEGKPCTDFTMLMTAGYEQVLRERLRKAYFAGAQAHEDHAEKLAEKMRLES